MNIETFKTKIVDRQQLFLKESIPGVKNIPMGKMFTEAAQGKLSKDFEMIVFCRTGGRAEM